MRGRLRFGSADDLALTALPGVLRDFRQLYPQINLELTVGQSGMLTRRLQAGHLDLVFVKQEPGTDGPGRVVRRDRLVWFGHKSVTLEPAVPVPLIVYQPPSMSREVAIGALEKAGRTWRITCNVREVNGILAAVRAGDRDRRVPAVAHPARSGPGLRGLRPAAAGRCRLRAGGQPVGGEEPVEALTQAIMSRPVQ